MKSLYFHMGHRDLVGGGPLALYYLAWALDDQFELHLSCEPHPRMGDYEFLEPPLQPWRIGRPGEVDVFLACSYTEPITPCGKTNLFYTFYPRIARPPGYDHVLTLSEYSRRAVVKNWACAPKVLCGGVFSDHYGPRFPKEPILLNSSRFFIEGDADSFRGHSKNQHILIRAFQELGVKGWRLILTGSIITEQDGTYLEACRRLAWGDPRIEFRPMAGKEDLRDLYARAKLYVHAMGYGRADPAETEHYGLSVEKALLSGCYTLVHNSGGAPELADEVWTEPADLVRTLRHRLAHGIDNEGLHAKARKRTLQDWRKEVHRTFAEWA